MELGKLCWPFVLKRKLGEIVFETMFSVLRTTEGTPLKELGVEQGRWPWLCLDFIWDPADAHRKHFKSAASSFRASEQKT